MLPFLNKNKVLVTTKNNIYYLIGILNKNKGGKKNGRIY